MVRLIERLIEDLFIVKLKKKITCMTVAWLIDGLTR